MRGGIKLLPVVFQLVPGFYTFDRMTAKTQILSDSDVRKTMKRLAYQVYERNFDEKEIVIAGITGRGTAVAEMLSQELQEICKLKVKFTEIRLDKDNPSKDGVTLHPAVVPEGKCIVVVDDVLNTGKTLVYALLPFVGSKPKKIQTLVLVDRNHKAFPVSADYIGISLSTTLQEHVEVSIEKGKVNVYLK